MKKTIFLCFIAIFFIAGISSCSKTSQPDLTKNIVGVYIGTIADTSLGFSSAGGTGSAVSVTKIDNTHVQVTPPSGFIPYVAYLTSASGGVYATAVSGTYSGVTYSAGSFFPQIPTGYSGAFNTTNGAFLYSISANDGTAYNEIYAGYK